MHSDAQSTWLFLLFLVQYLKGYSSGIVFLSDFMQDVYFSIYSRPTYIFNNTVIFFRRQFLPMCLVYDFSLNDLLAPSKYMFFSFQSYHIFTHLVTG